MYVWSIHADALEKYSSAAISTDIVREREGPRSIYIRLKTLIIIHSSCRILYNTDESFRIIR